AVQIERPASGGQPDQETTMGVYAQVIVPLLCDFGLDRPFVARYRRELLAHASGTILEIGFGTGLHLPYYPSHVRKVTTVDPNVGMYRRARRRRMRGKHRAGVSPQPTGEAPKADQHDLLARARAPGRLVGVRNEPAVVEGGNAGVRAAGPGQTTPG